MGCCCFFALMRHLKERNMIDYYNTLGISPSATREEIKECYHKLLLEYHPDKNGGTSTKTDEAFHLIDEAWKVLGNEEKRKAYDAQLKSRGTQCVPVHEEVFLTDMAYFSNDGQYCWDCRCGGVYLLSELEMDSEDMLVECDCCSLTIHVKC